jgi:hypothetical protein
MDTDCVLLEVGTKFCIYSSDERRVYTAPWLIHLVAGGPGSNRAGPCGVYGGRSCTATAFIYKSFRFAMSVTFLQCSVLILICKTTVGRMKTGGSSEISGAVVEIGEHNPQHHFHFFCFGTTQAIQLNAALQLWPHYKVKAARPVM